LNCWMSVLPLLFYYPVRTKNWPRGVFVCIFNAEEDFHRGIKNQERHTIADRAKFQDRFWK